MLNKMAAFLSSQAMVQPGDRVICAVSGGADSMAMLWAFYLLKEQLGIRLEAAHFNHGLRGEESARDADFVADFCRGYGIPLHLAQGTVTAGAKGLEAAAREARYGFLRSLPGKIATAHTADDNAETILMHLVRGTGLKGLGGITPVGENLIRPMLTVTRRQVLDFLQEYHLSWVEDSTNEGDDFLRNRLRHHVMPLMKGENPLLAEHWTEMALSLRQDEACLARLSQGEKNLQQLREMEPALRYRALAELLRSFGVREPDRRHLELTERLVFSTNPSARADLPGGITVSRCYDRLAVLEEQPPLEEIPLACPGVVEVSGWRLTCRPAQVLTENCFVPRGRVVIRSRREGDVFTTHGGRKTLKKLFIDKKIPAAQRGGVPVVSDEGGILAVAPFGLSRDRRAESLPAVELLMNKTEN